MSGLPKKLLADRDFTRTTLGRRWKAAVLAAVGNTVFDFLALLCAIRAVGASPRPSLVILAYASAELLAQIPFTPGGLGFVEAGLVGTLTLAGVPGPDALAATLLYRLVSYWLPIPVGGVAYLLFRRRYAWSPDAFRRVVYRARRFSRRTLTVSPASFPIALRTSAFTGSLWVPSPIAMNELWNGWPSIVPRTLTRPCVPKNSAAFGQIT